MKAKEEEPLYEPTQFGELNGVLKRLVHGAGECLGRNLAAVYLQGSFALGDADEYSDVDFLVLTNDDLSDAQERALQQMHADLYADKSQWAQHLEGSYAPRRAFRRVDPNVDGFCSLTTARHNSS